jgi:hypothetical protein
MSLQEKKAVFSIVSSIVILGGYFFYTFYIHASENLPLKDDVQFWASFTLTMIVVTIILKIIGHILFTIVLAATNKDEDPEFMDELDKKIELKSDRNGNYFFILGFIGSMIPVAMGMPVYYMFLILLIGGFVGGTLSDLWKIYYYRKGVR